MADEKQGQQKSPVVAAAWKFALLVALVAAIVGVLRLLRYRDEHRLDDFARCMSSKNTMMYGLYWCPHCKEQEDAFHDSFQYIHYVECGRPPAGGQPRGEQQSCVDAGIKNFPTWQFSDGQRHEGTLKLEELATKTGCKLP
jgi:glutaredoxin